jgi:hypothetical protein
MGGTDGGFFGIDVHIERCWSAGVESGVVRQAAIVVPGAAYLKPVLGCQYPQLPLHGDWLSTRRASYLGSAASVFRIRIK